LSDNKKLQSSAFIFKMQYCVSGIEFTGSCGVHHST